MNNIVELRKELSSIFQGLLDGTVENKDACELNNTAGKIINTVKVQLVYAALRKEMPDIAFLRPTEEVLESAPRQMKRLAKTLRVSEAQPAAQQ
jgi:hypothetical protein